MGFEQLAALRSQLAEKARQEKLAKQGGAGQGRGPRPPKPQVARTEGDPVSSTKAEAGTADASNKSGERKPAVARHGGGGRPGAPRPGGGKPEGARAGGGQKQGAPRKLREERAPRPAREPAAPADPVLMLIRKLQNRFGATFPKKPAPKVPLKIGIFEDLMAHSAELGADEAQLRAAIKTWCGGARYWACMVEGVARIDLKGEAAGEVTAADANRARRLEAHREKRTQQRTAAAQTPAASQNPAQSAADAAVSADAASADAASVDAKPVDTASDVVSEASPSAAQTSQAHAVEQHAGDAQHHAESASDLTAQTDVHEESTSSSTESTDAQ
jgi:ProP effector